MLAKEKAPLQCPGSPKGYNYVVFIECSSPLTHICSYKDTVAYKVLTSQAHMCMLLMYYIDYLQTQNKPEV